MRRTSSAFLFASGLMVCFLVLISLRAYAQTSQADKNTSTAQEKPYDWRASFAKVKVGKVPRLADGKPDLQGIWSFSILTPLERPRGVNKSEVTATEAREDEDAAQQAEINLRVESTVTPPGEKTTDAYNSFWRDGYWYKVPMTTLHTSQVVDPPSGHIPPLTAAAKERQAEAYARLNRPAIGPEDRPLSSRCISGARSGPPIIGQGPGSQVTTLEIVESPQTVVVRQEAMHDAQIVYLDGRPAPPPGVELQKGAARGHWEGDTLVVDSTNFAPWRIGAFTAYGTTNQMHLEERWKRLDADHLLYGFTMDDPGTWTKPWSVEFVLWRMANQQHLVEYACHEGNVNMEFTLSAARAKEQQQAAVKQ